MTKRSELGHRRAEAQARMMHRVLTRALSRKTTGLDGIAKTLVAKKLGAAEQGEQPER